ncbi:hypothetical protein BJX76DRAFT_329312 [Aspergillus varians]
MCMHQRGALNTYLILMGSTAFSLCLGCFSSCAICNGDGVYMIMLVLVAWGRDYVTVHI